VYLKEYPYEKVEVVGCPTPKTTWFRVQIDGKPVPKQRSAFRTEEEHRVATIKRAQHKATDAKAAAAPPAAAAAAPAPPLDAFVEEEVEVLCGTAYYPATLVRKVRGGHDVQYKDSRIETRVGPDRIRRPGDAPAEARAEAAPAPPRVTRSGGGAASSSAGGRSSSTVVYRYSHTGLVAAPPAAPSVIVARPQRPAGWLTCKRCLDADSKRPHKYNETCAMGDYKVS